jgi:hypothetical protein
MRTADGYSKTVSAGTGMFTLLGFMGIYTVLGILFLFLVRREIEQGPEGPGEFRPPLLNDSRPGKLRLQKLEKDSRLQVTHRD